MKKLIAFTLAETLIVMGIIGIVSALTLPNLNSSTGEKEKVAKVKKIYRDLNEAYSRAQAIYGPFGEWFNNDTTSEQIHSRFVNRFSESMKTSKVELYTITLADGATVTVEGLGAPDWIELSIDIDGPNKGKNQIGKDQFAFSTISYEYVDSNGSNGSYYDPSSIRPYYDGKITRGASTIMSETRWVIDYDNMDYLKLDSSGKCPNGTALNYLANPPVISCK